MTAVTRQDELARLARTLHAVHAARCATLAADPGATLAGALAATTPTPGAQVAAKAPAELAEECSRLAPTDLGNAHRLVRRARGELLAVASGGWLVWDGTRWAPDDPQATVAIKAAMHTAEEIQAEVGALRAGGAADKELSQRFQFHLRSQGQPRLRAMLDLARALLPVRAADLDRDRDRLTTPVGTVDLRTGKLRAHDRADLITKTTRTEYDPEAQAPAWDAFLAQVMPDPALRRWIQRLAGYLLTGHTGEQELYALLGTGANGKSVFVSTIARAAGDYALNSSIETFMASPHRGGGDARPDLVRLRGARLVTASESAAGMQFNERLVKEITGGEPITARAMYRAEETFTPQFKLLVSCNALPRFDGSDYALRRRLRVVPFDVTIAEADRDPHLTRRLERESAGILAWMVRGAVAWYADGLGECAAVASASERSARDMDPVGRFLEDRCALVGEAFSTSAQIAAAYTAWARENREPEFSAKRIADTLHRHGLRDGRKKVAGRLTRGWNGVLLITNPDAPVTRGDTSSRTSSRENDLKSPGTTCHHVSPADGAASERIPV